MTRPWPADNTAVLEASTKRDIVDAIVYDLHFMIGSVREEDHVDCCAPSRTTQTQLEGYTIIFIDYLTASRYDAALAARHHHVPALFK